MTPPISTSLRIAPLLLSAFFAGCSSSDNDDDSDNPGITEPSAQFASGATSAGEGLGTVAIAVELSEAAEDDVTLPYTLAGTALAGDDYTLLSPNPLVIVAGQTTGTIFIDLIDDDDDNPDLTIEVSLGDPDGADLGATVTHVLTIQDDDDALIPEIEPNNDSQDAGNNGTMATLGVGSTASFAGNLDAGTAPPDQFDVFQIEASEDITATVLLTPLASVDLVVFVTNPTGGLLTPFENDGPAGEVETATVDLAAGGTYMIVCHVPQNGGAGDYRLDVSGSAIVVPLTGPTTPPYAAAQIADPGLRLWLEAHGLLPQRPVVLSQRQGWIVVDGRVIGFSDDTVLQR